MPSEVDAAEPSIDAAQRNAINLLFQYAATIGGQLDVVVQRKVCRETCGPR